MQKFKLFSSLLQDIITDYNPIIGKAALFNVLAYLPLIHHVVISRVKMIEYNYIFRKRIKS